MTEPLALGATIGILGGGQLGRMLSVAASRLGFKCHIFEPSAAPPAGQVANGVTTAPYSDEAGLCAFAACVDVITYEFENIPTSALDILEELRPVRPNRRALAASQDRVLEKQFLNDLGLITAPFAAIDTLQDLQSAAQTIGFPAILKTRRFGYDGKGQILLTSEDQLSAAIKSFQKAPGILEGFVDFSKEISVIGARSQSGEVVCFDPGENIHKDGILETTTVPATLTLSQQTDAVLLTGKILNALEYVGVMGVELFVTPQGLVVNEIAPRVHNSGHWTQNGCVVDQFEQHVRAVAGWPLGDGARHSDVVMRNLIGDDISDLDALQNDPAVGLHLYGKAEVKPGRKMGHINRITGSNG